MNTMEQIEAAMNAFDPLTSLQKRNLITFMDFTAADSAESIKYLDAAKWIPQEAADLYWKDHPDKGMALSFLLRVNLKFVIPSKRNSYSQ